VELIELAQAFVPSELIIGLLVREQQRGLLPDPRELSLRSTAHREDHTQAQAQKRLRLTEAPLSAVHLELC
jgi:hypothetical protein